MCVNSSFLRGWTVSPPSVHPHSFAYEQQKLQISLDFCQQDIDLKGLGEKIVCTSL